MRWGATNRYITFTGGSHQQTAACLSFIAPSRTTARHSSETEFHIPHALDSSSLHLRSSRPIPITSFPIGRPASCPFTFLASPLRLPPRPQSPPNMLERWAKAVSGRTHHSHACPRTSLIPEAVTRRGNPGAKPPSPLSRSGKGARHWPPSHISISSRIVPTLRDLSSANFASSAQSVQARRNTSTCNHGPPGPAPRGPTIAPCASMPLPPSWPRGRAAHPRQKCRAMLRALVTAHIPRFLLVGPRSSRTVSPCGPAGNVLNHKVYHGRIAPGMTRSYAPCRTALRHINSSVCSTVLVKPYAMVAADGSFSTPSLIADPRPCVANIMIAIVSVTAICTLSLSCYALTKNTRALRYDRNGARDAPRRARSFLQSINNRERTYELANVLRDTSAGAREASQQQPHHRCFRARPTPRCAERGDGPIRGQDQCTGQ